MEHTAQQNADLAQYTLARQLATQLLDAIHGLENMQTRWDALDSGSTMIAGEGVHLGLLPADIGAVIFATADAMRALLAAGHGTNIAKLL